MLLAVGDRYEAQIAADRDRGREVPLEPHERSQTFTFYVFAAILVFAALRVVTARNPVHAALWLVLAFFTAAGIWLLLQAEFLAIALVLVYVGAVMVLFLFVVMMLDVNFDQLRHELHELPAGRRDRSACWCCSRWRWSSSASALGAADGARRRRSGRQQHPGAGHGCSTPTTSTRSRSRRWSCWSRSSRRSR